jgi:uncharacterized protein YbcI
MRHLLGDRVRGEVDATIRAPAGLRSSHPTSQRIRAMRPACDRDFGPLSGAQRHAQPMAAYVVSLSGAGYRARGSLARLFSARCGFSEQGAGALEPLRSPHYDLHSSVSETDAKPAGRPPLGGGQLLAAISTRIVGILREHYGRGPMRAKTYALDDIIVVVMRGSGFTPLEQTIMDSGEPDRVIAMREDFQRVMAAQYKKTIEELTGRTVLAFLSQAHVEPDITMEIFFVDGPLEGFGAVEVTEPE